MGALHDGHRRALRAARARERASSSRRCSSTRRSSASRPTSPPTRATRRRDARDRRGARRRRPLRAEPPTRSTRPASRTWVDVDDDRRRGRGRGPGTSAASPPSASSSSTSSRPRRAYFGQKDAQQAVVIRRLVRDLNLAGARSAVAADRARPRRPRALVAQRAPLAPRSAQRALGLPRALAARRDGARTRRRRSRRHPQLRSTD